MPKNFNMPKKGQMGGMMQQMQRLQEQLVRTQEELAQETLTHSAGGGAIRLARATRVGPSLSNTPWRKVVSAASSGTPSTCTQ